MHDWNRLFLRADGKKAVQLLVDTMETQVGSALDADAICQIRSFLTPESSSKPWPWYNWAFDLTVKLGLHSEAAVACRTAIKIDPRNAYAWNGLGDLLQRSAAMVRISLRAASGRSPVSPEYTRRSAHHGRVLL
jgi:hypothetical protein